MKKKITLVATSVLLVAAMVIGGTLAYFTDSQSQTNKFTSGNVDINLSETVVKADADGNLVATTARTSDEQSYKLYPGMTVAKDPRIDVLEGSEPAYIAAKVTITGNLSGLIGVEGYNNIDITQLASGGLMAAGTSEQCGTVSGMLGYQNNACKIYQDASGAAKNTWVMYIFVTEAQLENAKVTLFDTLTISDEYNNTQMAMLNGMEIVVDAYAVQQYGFTSCEEAMAEAFPSVFSAFAS